MIYVFIYSVLILVGLFLLYKGANWVLRAGVYIAEKTGVPKFIVGVTIIAIGTSIPELIVNLLSSSQGRSDLLVGNILGSNISNILFVVGITAVFVPVKVKKLVGRRDIPFSFLGIIILITLLADKFLLGTVHNDLTRQDGAILLIIFLIFVYYTLFSYREHHEEIKSYSVKTKVSQEMFWGLLGLVSLIIGGILVVENSVLIAQYFDIPEKIIGLSIISIGTSLPELVTTLVAVREGHSDIGVGNIIGSNIINLLFILGLSVFINPVEQVTNVGMDLLILSVATILLYFSLFLGKRNKVDRVEGVFFLVIYFIYLVSLFIYQV